MVAISIARYRVAPGKADEFRALAQEYKQYLDGFGGRTSYRQSVFDGDTVGTISMIVSYPDATVRAAALDRILADIENNPSVKPLASASPPATLMSRSLLNSFAPAAEEPIEPNVVSSRLFVASPAKQGAATTALKAATARNQELGATALALRVTAGPDRGAFLLALGFESMSGLQEFTAKTQARSDPPPALQAEQAGVMTLVSSRVSVLLWGAETASE